MDTTIDAARAALAADPTNAALHTDHGMALFAAGRYDEALDAFQRALANNPDHAAAHNGIGRVHYHIGPPEAAIAAYTRAITADPHSIQGYWGLGILYYAQLGRYDDALAIFRRGVAANPRDGSLYTGIGHALARSGQLDEAITAYRMASRIDAASPEGDSGIAIVQLAAGRLRAALEAMCRAIAIAPGLPWQHRVRGIIHDRLGEGEAAIAALELAATLDPQDYEAHAGLARAYRAAGRDAEATDQEARGRALAEGADAYGRACLESLLGDHDAAVALLAAALAEGQLTPGWARLDPELTYLQGDPRYGALLAAPGA